MDPAKSALANILIGTHWSFLCFVSLSFFIITQHNTTHNPFVLWCCFSACPTSVSTCFTVKSSSSPRFVTYLSPTTVIILCTTNIHHLSFTALIHSSISFQFSHYYIFLFSNTTQLVDKQVILIN